MGPLTLKIDTATWPFLGLNDNFQTCRLSRFGRDCPDFWPLSLVPIRDSVCPDFCNVSRFLSSEPGRLVDSDFHISYIHLHTYICMVNR